MNMNISIFYWQKLY